MVEKLKTIRSVHLVGLGAIGGMYASLLHDLDPSLLTVVADQKRRSRHASKGVTINGKRYEFNYRDPADKGDPADLVFVTVKQHHLEQSVSDMSHSVGDGTTIVSLLNGITSEEIIGAAFGMEKMLYSFCVETDATREGDEITYTKVGTVVFGEPTNAQLTDRVTAVRNLLDRASIPYRIPRDMMRELWWKFMMNVGINPVSAILRAPYGVFQRIEEARKLFAMAASEAVALSAAEGINLAQSDIDRCFEIFATLSPDGKTSMLQDVEAGRQTEIELFAGTVVRLGRRHSIATPINEMLLRMIRTIEATYSNAWRHSVESPDR